MEERNAQSEFLCVEGLTVEYTSGGSIIHAVNDVSFTLQKGHTIGLVGETGAGKTTIAKAILRVLPNPPAKVTKGRVWLEGEELLSMKENEIRKVQGRKISMIFQDPMTALNPVMKVGAQIAEVIREHNHNLSKKEVKKKAVETLEKVGIPGSRYEEYPHQFSGGMKQRVVIAMALAANPELILADEPTTALDVTIQAQVLDMMNQLKKELGTSMILITHDLGVIAEMCNEVCVVYAGEIVESGTLSDIFDSPSHPYTVGLFDSLPRMDVRVSRLKPISGMMPNPSELPEGCYFSPRCPYATDACKKEKIPLRELSPGHYCRCIRKVEREEVKR